MTLLRATGALQKAQEKPLPTDLQEMKKFASLAALVLLTHSSTSAARLPERVDRLAQPYVDSETVVGMSIGVIRGDETVVRGYGRLTANSSQHPDGRTIYLVRP